MADQTTPLHQIWERLPIEKRQEALDYLENLLHETEDDDEQEFIEFSWAGGLEELRDQYTSVELQKKALEWRDE